MNRYGPFAFHHGHALFAWFFLALVGALVALGVLAVILLWRRAARTGPFRGVGSVPAAPSDPAVAEVRMRYARGEISSEDYARRLADLGYPMAPGQWPPVPGSVAPTPTPPPPPPPVPPSSGPDRTHDPRPDGPPGP